MPSGGAATYGNVGQAGTGRGSPWKTWAGVPVAVGVGNRARARLWTDDWAARQGYDVVASGGAVSDKATEPLETVTGPTTRWGRSCQPRGSLDEDRPPRTEGS